MGIHLNEVMEDMEDKTYALKNRSASTGTHLNYFFMPSLPIQKFKMRIIIGVIKPGHII